MQVGRKMNPHLLHFAPLSHPVLRDRGPPRGAGPARGRRRRPDAPRGGSSRGSSAPGRRGGGASRRARGTYAKTKYKIKSKIKSKLNRKSNGKLNRKSGSWDPAKIELRSRKFNSSNCYRAFPHFRENLRKSEQIS